VDVGDRVNVGHARRWIGRSAPWLFVFASAATAFPIVVARVIGRPFPGIPGAPLEWLWIRLAGILLIACAPLATIGYARSPARASWIRALLPFGPVVVGGAALGFLGEEAWLEPFSLAHAAGDDWTKWLLVLPPFIVAALAFGRRGVSAMDGVMQVRYAAIALWLVGCLWAHMNSDFAFACFGPVDWAEFAGCSVFKSTFRMACGVTAASWIAMSLAMQGLAVRDRLARIDTVGVAVWIATSVAVDGVGFAAGRAVCGATDGRAELSQVDELATLAAAVQGFGTAAAVLCWGLGGVAALGRASDDARRESWRALWPLLPILWIASSPAFDVPLPVHSGQQLPDAAWEQRAAFEPLTRAAIAGRYVEYRGYSESADVIGTLSADGALWLYHRDHAYVSRGDADVVMAPDLEYGRRVVQLMVDRRATLGQLARVARRLRRFDGISIVWRTNELHRASPRARDRWAFVEMASRAVAGYELALHRAPTGCVARRHAGLRFARCDRGRVLEGPDALSVEALLPVLERSEGAWGIAVPADLTDGEVERPIGGMRRPPDPLDLRVVPTMPLDAFALAIGLVALVFTAIIGREYVCARRLTRSGARVDHRCATTTASSAWRRWRASLRDGPVAHPYRRRGTARACTALGLLRRDLAELAVSAARACALGSVTWVVVTWLGLAVGAAALWLAR
jgi:hypothetical protein